MVAIIRKGAVMEMKNLNPNTVTIIGGNHASVSPQTYFEKTDTIDIGNRILLLFNTFKKISIILKAPALQNNILENNLHLNHSICYKYFHSPHTLQLFVYFALLQMQL